jgi:hypothetical protein
MDVKLDLHSLQLWQPALKHNKIYILAKFSLNKKALDRRMVSIGMTESGYGSNCYGKGLKA